MFAINFPFVFSLVSQFTAYFSLSELPQALAQSAGISVWAAQCILTLMIVLGAELPVIIYARGAAVPAMIVGVAALCLCLALGWLDFTIFCLMLLVASFFFAMKFRDIFLQKGGGEG